MEVDCRYLGLQLQGSIFHIVLTMTHKKKYITRHYTHTHTSNKHLTKLSTLNFLKHTLIFSFCEYAGWNPVN